MSARVEEAVRDEGISSADVFNRVLLSGRRYLMSLTYAIGNVSYVDSCLAATQLRVTLDEAEWLACRLRREVRTDAERRLRLVKALAAPMLALAPKVGVRALLHLRMRDDRSPFVAWERAARQWARVLHARLATDGGAGRYRPYIVRMGETADGDA